MRDHENIQFTQGRSDGSPGHWQSVNPQYTRDDVPMPPPPRKHSGKALWILLAAGVFTLLLCGGLVGITALAPTANDRPIPDATATPDPGVRPPAVAVQPTAAPITKPVPKPAPAPVVANTFVEEGDYTVGADIPAGTYKVTQPVSGMCYWGIYKTGTNKDSIIANDIVTGGRPTVTLKAGQDFSSNGCGTWGKIK
jgi:hypothetical protein